MNGRFKAKCVYTDSLKCYTKGKIYEIVNGCLIGDREEIMYNDLISIEDLQKRSCASWVLVDDYEEEDNMGNFKVRCLDTKGVPYYTKGKVYEMIDGTLIDEYGGSLFSIRINSIKDLNGYSIAKWELVEENTKNLSLTITSEKATISDGEDTLEIDNNWYKNERDMINDLLDKYYDEKNKIKVGDTVKVVDKGCQFTTYSDFIFKNAEELQKQMSATEFARLILNFKNGVSIPERASTYKVNLINKLLSFPASNTKVAIISNDNDTFIIDTRGLEKVKER